ncbi:MAG: hypothetical protein ACTSQL_01720 [Promethearchaeota archaeon]
MAKDKKKKLGIKTTRYYTKTCTSCNYEYPNWFTNCPKCGAAWDSDKAVQVVGKKEVVRKTIKIVVKITEEDFDDAFERVLLIFSADQGVSWYSLRMENEVDYFIAEIVEVPLGTIVIYYIEVLLAHGEKIVENNEGKYFRYKVGLPMKDLRNEGDLSTESIPQSSEHRTSKIRNQFTENSESIEQSEVEDELDKIILDESIQLSELHVNNKSDGPPPQPKKYHVDDTKTIFGTLQTQIDPELKVCPFCNSKIKKMWSMCPICGKNL